MGPLVRKNEWFVGVLKPEKFRKIRVPGLLKHRLSTVSPQNLEKKKYNYTLDIKLLRIFPQDYIQNVWEKVGKTPPFEIVTEGPHILVEIAGNLL